MVKAGGQHLCFNIFGRPPQGHTIKTNFITFQTVDPEICSILIFLQKNMGPACPPYFVDEFSRKIFLMLFLLTDQISLSGCLYFLRY